MGKVSTLIGSVVTGETEFNRTINNEDFYTVLVNFRGTKIDVLYSKYTYPGVFTKDTKIKVVGSFMSINKRNDFSDYYIYAHSITEVDFDEDTTNLINFSCTITKVKNMTVGARCNDTLPLIGKDKSPLNSVSVIYLCVRDADARRLQSKPPGYVIQGKGYIKKYRSIHEILVTEIENLDKLCPIV